MATSLLLACGLNEPQLPGGCTFIGEESDVDASFIVTCLLGQRTKVAIGGGGATVLLCLQHTFQHYAGAAVRLGFNLQAARDKGTLRVIEPLADVVARQLPADDVRSHDDNDTRGGAFLEASPDAMLADLWQRVRRAVDALANASKSIAIIVDDVAALLDLGATENAALLFCRQLVRWTASGSAADGPATMAVSLKLSTCNLYEHLANNLAAMADAEIRCIRLRSGNFREVDGRLVTVRRPNAEAPNECVQKSMLYKVNERNVKIFAPGEVGIRI